MRSPYPGPEPLFAPYRGRRLDRRLPVEVYRNLNRGGWSVRQGGLVVAHAGAIMLANVEFVVRAAGRRRALASGRRNVHAWARGEVVESGMGTTPEEAERDRLPRVRYDLRAGRFMLLVTRPPTAIEGARIVAFNGRGAFAAYTWRRS